MTIPDGHQSLMPYLILKGAAQFAGFTKNVFNATLANSQMRDDNSTIMHAEIRINGSTIMFAEATDKWKPATSNIFIYVTDADETYKKAIAEGAETILELRDESYGRTCGVADPFGNIWWITSVK